MFFKKTLRKNVLQKAWVFFSGGSTPQWFFDRRTQPIRAAHPRRVLALSMMSHSCSMTPFPRPQKSATLAAWFVQEGVVILPVELVLFHEFQVQASIADFLGDIFFSV